MTAVTQPDLRAALRLARDLEDAVDTVAVRDAILRRLPELIPCDALTWATLDLDSLRVVDVAGTAPAIHGAAGGVLHRLLLDLHHRPGLVLRLALHRTDRAFDDRELAVLELLRPHLLDAIRRADDGERLASLRLTPRERAVLERVAAGDANLAIAHRLGMRPRTVEKHLEHVYAKLGVASRTAAVARLRAITH